MNEVVATLRDLFEKQRKSYEKSKKAKRKGDTSEPGSSPQTAHTVSHRTAMRVVLTCGVCVCVCQGQLNQLIGQASNEVMAPIDQDEIGVQPAEDVSVNEEALANVRSNAKKRNTRNC